MAMLTIWVYSILSVIIVSLISLVGIFTLIIKKNLLKNFLIHLVSLAAGTLLGDAFFHLIPEAVEISQPLFLGTFILIGIMTGFVIEKYIRWHHCHHIHSKNDECGHSHVASMNLFGDSIHNFLDGLIIGASYLASIPVGIATTIAVVLHEIPQELSDFGVLLHGGYSRVKALWSNFFVSLTSVLGAVIALIFGNKFFQFENFLIPFAAGTFIYIATADLIPEIHNNERNWDFLFIILGIVLMVALLYLE